MDQTFTTAMFDWFPQALRQKLRFGCSRKASRDITWTTFVFWIVPKNTFRQFNPPAKASGISWRDHLKDRTWICKVCKTKHDRDTLASNNIKQIGLGQPKFTPVENHNSYSSEAGNPIPLGVG